MSTTPHDLSPFLDDLTRAAAALEYQAQLPGRPDERARDHKTALALRVLVERIRQGAPSRCRVVSITTAPNGTVYVATSDGLVWRNVLLDYPTRRWDGTESRHVWAPLEAGRVPGCLP